MAIKSDDTAYCQIIKRRDTYKLAEILCTVCGIENAINLILSIIDWNTEYINGFMDISDSIGYIVGYSG